VKVRQIRHTIILGVLALVGIVIIQGYWLSTTWQMQQEKLDNAIWLALKNIASEMNMLHSCLPNDLNPVEQLSETCYLVDVSCEYNQKNLEHLIPANFNKQHIHIEYQVAIYNCNALDLEYLGRFSASGEKLPGNGNLNFCKPIDNHELVYYFIINISGKNVYLIKQMRLWFLLSFIVLIIVLFFTYTIFAFFKQKLLAELQKDFINNMTHEFKTPISSINIASDVLLSYPETSLPERFNRYARLIKQENNRLNQQVENVLRAARIEKGKTLMELEPIDLHAVLSDVFTPQLFLSQNSRLTIKTDYKATRSMVLADKLHLTNLLLNLADNSIKYNRSEWVEMTVKTRNLGKFIELRIKDNGIGIAPKYKKKIFSKFFRVPTGNVHDVKGFGLGLFYVKQVCDAHNWSITFESPDENGVEFIISMRTYENGIA
jgi:two-component system phosphate regulon sensor histidine kinase PhoR